MISIHALLAESDLSNNSRRFLCPHFYPRSPCGERLCAPKMAKNSITISIHALLAESDSAVWLYWHLLVYFYPRSPCGERLILHMAHLMGLLFLSTLSLRRATSTTLTFPGFGMISIHALLAESDHYDNYNLHCVEISIHALLAESDAPGLARLAPGAYFYPRSPCGERPRD